MSQSSRVSVTLGSLDLINRRLSIGSVDEELPSYKPTSIVSLADADDVLTVDELKTGVFTMTSTAITRTLTLPDASLLVEFLNETGKSIDISVINLGASNTSIDISPGSGGTLIGSARVYDETVWAASSGLFRIITTDSATPLYNIIRLC